MPKHMSSDEIRETYLSFFEARDHKRLPSGSLVPATHDPSVLLTTAGMQPLKPYFLGQEKPPHHRLTTCQKVFRTTDIENVGNTTRHLTFFEMLGNFSIGDYFKQGAVEYAWEFSLQVLELNPEDIWITVFEGDEELGLGPDEEATAAWESVGVPRERIVLLPRSENFWQAGPTGPCGPCSELYFDRGVEFGAPDDLPGGENERFVEYWNLVFMQFNQDPVNTLIPLPAKNIDTGLGLNRMAMILQDVPSIFETDQFKPLMELGEELSHRRYGEAIASEDAFRLHDTYGFPIDLTLELVAEHGLGVDEAGFEALMDDQRRRARATARAGLPDDAGRERVREFAGAAGFETEFTGYATTEQATTVGAVERENGRVLVKLAESPFYPAGGGQVSDAGTLECADGDCRAHVAEVYRLGDDQAVAVAVEEGDLEPGERVVARVDAVARHATEANHTATHLLHAALRERLGGHVRQAGSYVGPDKLRFDFTHGQALTPDELRDIEDRVNEWVLANHPVRALTTTLDEARRLGAMALFGEKYGDVVRMVEVGDGTFSRELCGGTHVRSTAEVGLFKILSESSSAANVRRIEALTGPEGVELMREHDRALGEIAARLRSRPEHAVEA